MTARRWNLNRKMRVVNDLAYKNAKVTYKQIRKALDEGENWHFENLPPVKSSGDKKSDPKMPSLSNLKAFHSFRKSISDKLGKEYWGKPYFNFTKDP